MEGRSLAATYCLKDGTRVPRLGQGTWYLGQGLSPRARERDTLRLGVELGMTLIDTAEMYGEGRSEQLIGEALRGLDRDKLFLVSKVYPHNAGRGRLERSLEASLRRLGTDYLDLYLLHWRGSVPLEETAREMERQVSLGRIRRWGVSNLDRSDMEELMATGLGEHCMVDQVLYHLGSRGVEYDLQGWLAGHGMALMAYCPLAQGGTLRRGLMSSPAVVQAARAHGATPAQVLLNFVLQRDNVIAIPKASSPQHVRENAGALEFCLTPEELAALDRAFPPPDRPVPLDIV